MDKEKENVQEEQQEKADHMAEESQQEKKTDSKHEDVSSDDEKEQSKEKTYTQAQVDAMMAKVRKKYTKSDVKEEQQEDTQEIQSQRDLSTGITVEKLAQAELKAEMAIQGIAPLKVARAVRLIDVNDVIDETGQYSEKMAQTAIEELLKEWPELKQTSHGESNSFDFGAPEQPEQNEQDLQETKSAFSKIFGN